MRIDEQLIEDCRKAKPGAQKELYCLLLPYLRSVVMRYLRDVSFQKDVLQESFVRIFKKINQYDPQKAPFAQWSARIAINVSYNYNKRVCAVPFESLDSSIEKETFTLDTDYDTWTDDQLLGLIRKMPSEYYEVFNLYIIDGYSHKEIASILDIREELSRQRLVRGRKWIRKVVFAKSSHTEEVSAKVKKK